MMIMKNKNVVYGALVGHYDDIPKHKHKMEGWDYVLFTDICNLKEKNGWEIRPLRHLVKNQDDDNNKIKTARWHKTNPHKLFPEYEYSLWIDTNINVLDKTLDNFINLAISNNDEISTVKHPLRDCIYEEAAACEASGKDAPGPIKNVVNFISKEGFPKHYGLFETNLLLRKHNMDKVKRVSEIWWDVVNKYSRRDQLSFSYALWKEKANCTYLLGESRSVRNLSGFTILGGHGRNNKKKYLKKIKKFIFYIKIKKDIKIIRICGFYLLKRDF